MREEGVKCSLGRPSRDYWAETLPGARAFEGRITQWRTELPILQGY